MKIVSIVGARPQFVKLAAIADAMATSHDVEHIIVHTGQHYDSAMSDVFFGELGIPSPHVHLGVGSGSHATQTGRMLTGLESVLQEFLPNWALVYGDTNSTLAGALAAAKLHVPVAHLEAGLRSFNRKMPEEHNRVLTDHASDLLLAPTETAMRHLQREGLADRSLNVGDVMTDVCFRTRAAVEAEPVDLPPSVPPELPYVVATIHRAENTDAADRLRRIVDALRALDSPVVLVAHPRLVARARALGISLLGGALHTVPPWGYRQMLRAVLGSAGVVTDSGGLQKEAFLLRVPCTTLRSETEWPETLRDGWNILDPDIALVAAVAVRDIPTAAQDAPFGDGAAAPRVVSALRNFC